MTIDVTRLLNCTITTKVANFHDIREESCVLTEINLQSTYNFKSLTYHKM